MVAPAFIAVVQMWYKRGEQTNRNAAWYSMLGIVNILGSLLSYGLGHIKSDRLYSYQIIFLFCGLLTVVVSVFVYIFMPGMYSRCTPRTAWELQANGRFRLTGGSQVPE
jgi:MFS family permease